MTQDRKELLFELGADNPDVARMVSELNRLADLTTNEMAKATIIHLVDGWLSCVGDPVSPWLEPIPIEEGLNCKGYKDGSVRDIDVLYVDLPGETKPQPHSLWFCASFARRVEFLQTGLLTIGYLPGLICPVRVHVSPEELGIKPLES